VLTFAGKEVTVNRLSRTNKREPTSSNAARPLYPIRAAARLARLSSDTLRAWERRYNAVKPVRRKGKRFYSDADIERLLLLRTAVELGYAIRQASGMSNEELLAIQKPAGLSRTAASAEGCIETTFTAIEQFHFADASRELGRLASLMPPRELIHNVALPLMRIVGERWHEQRLRIAQEHLMTQLLGNLLAAMMRTYAPLDPPATILTATLSGDLHEFGVFAAAILAAGAGIGVVHLGADLPAGEIVYAVRRSRADVVLISVTNAQDRILREEQLRSIQKGTGSQTEIWVGLNPPNTVFDVKGIRFLKDFGDLERELLRIGGRF
jgi:DNA-binding transcriptional MerR regulator/methylmalonyl-CoA mutase cobalamin-binding subunit